MKKTKIEETVALDTLNKEVVKKLGKRVKKSKTSNAIEIDTQMTNHDKQLDESVSSYSLLIVAENVLSKFGATVSITEGKTKGAIWSDGKCLGDIKLDTYHDCINIRFTKGESITLRVPNYYDEDDSTYERYMEKAIREVAKAMPNSEELLDKEYREYLDKQEAEKKHPKYYTTKDGVDMIRNDAGGYEEIDESVLTEMTANDIVRKSKNEDPERVNRASQVKSTYIGMSKFGILNFKTTSQTRSGYHYQTVEFQDMKFFEDIIKSGRAITPDDVKKAIETQDINVWCTDESFTWWAWGHLAYKYDFLYIDDRIPDLKSRIQAPTVNNVRLNGGSCKHILSVLNYIKKPFTLLAISDDMNAYLNQEETKADKQDETTRDRLDQVKTWDMSDVEEYTGLSKAQIMSDISKSLQVAPMTDKGEIIQDLVNDALPNEDQGLIRDITDRIEELITEEE